MKKILVFAASFLTLSAYANCPQLAGSYPTCQLKDMNIPYPMGLKITQGVVDGHTRYAIEHTGTNDNTAIEMVANGQLFEFVGEDADGQSVTYRSKTSCAANKVTMNVEVVNNGNPQLFSRSSNSFSRAGQSLQWDMTIETADEGSQTISLICQ